MTHPIVFVSNQKVREGRFEEYARLYRQTVKVIEANKPGTVAHLAYANEDGTQVTILHVFPDAEAMELHMQGVGELAKKALEYMEIVSFEIYGRPGARILEMMHRAAGSAVPVTIKPQPIGGYLRLRAG